MKEVVNVSQQSRRFSGAMSAVLSIIAIAVLLVLIGVSLKLRHETRAGERKQANLRAHVGDAQEEGSLRRRAEVRGAAAERAGTIAPHTDD